MRSLVVAIVIVMSFQSSGLALTNEEVFSQFQFNFITPGARATGLGGAFIGLADDATAVESNPAGLTQLYESEVSLEFKHIAYVTEQIFENLRYSTDITRREFDNAVQSIPFASVAFPYKRFVFSLYRQELINYESSFRTSQYPIRYQDEGGRGVIYSIDASTDLTVTNYGIGFAVQPVEGLSVAVSPRWSEMKLEAFSDRFRAETTDVFDFPEPTDFSEEDIVNSTSIDDSDANFSINAGLMWRLQWLEEKFDIPRVSIGAVYRSGAKFEVTETFVSTIFLDLLDTWPEVSDLTRFTLKIPDSFGAGIVVRPIDDLTLTLDVVQIQYEDLLEDFDIVLNQAEDLEQYYTIDNAIEVHFGMEYVLSLGERFLALRAGVYNDPEHTIRYKGDDIVGKILFPGGDDQIHITGGVGLVISEKFQIDTATNISDTNKQVSISTVYRF
jgi:long-subunit fatty acid transport protein